MMFAPRGLLIILFLYEVNCYSSIYSCSEPVISSWPDSYNTCPSCASSPSCASVPSCGNGYYYPPTLSTNNPKGINSCQSSYASLSLTKPQRKNYTLCNKRRGKCGSSKKLRNKCGRKYNNKLKSCASTCASTCSPSCSPSYQPSCPPSYPLSCAPSCPPSCPLSCAPSGLTVNDELELLLGTSCPCYACSGYSPCSLSCSEYYPCGCSCPCGYTSYCSY